MAMQARINEHTSYSHLQMNFVEFLEGIARAAECLSLGPPSDHIREAYKEFIYKEEVKGPSTQRSKNIDELCEGEGQDGFMSDEEGAFLSEDEHVNQPLVKKIDNMIPFLLAFCTSLGFKRKWRWPRKNPHNGLYTEVKESGVKGLKAIIVNFIMKVIVSRLNLKEIVKRKKMNIKLRGM